MIAVSSRRFIFSPSKTFAGARSGSVRELEQRLETLRPIEQGRRVRGLLRRARLDEFFGDLIQMFDSTIVRAHVSAAGAKGARTPGARSFARRFHHENPRKIGRIGRHHRFRSDRRRGCRRAAFRNAARHRPGHSTARRHLRQGLRQQGQPGAARARGIAPVIPHKSNEKDKPKFFARTLYKARARIEQGIGRINASSVSRYAAKRQPETSDPS